MIMHIVYVAVENFNSGCKIGLSHQSKQKDKSPKYNPDEAANPTFHELVPKKVGIWLWKNG